MKTIYCPFWEHDLGLGSRTEYLKPRIWYTTKDAAIAALRNFRREYPFTDLNECYNVPIERCIEENYLDG